MYLVNKKAGIVILATGLALTIFTALTFFTKGMLAGSGNIKITKDDKPSDEYNTQ